MQLLVRAGRGKFHAPAVTQPSVAPSRKRMLTVNNEHECYAAEDRDGPETLALTDAAIISASRLQPNK